MSETVKQTFLEGKGKILQVWPRDRIIENIEEKLVIRCKNNTYLIYSYISLPEDLPEEVRRQMAFMDNKVMWQWSPDLSEGSYSNISSEIMGDRKITNPRVKEALQELSKWLIVHKALF